MTIWGKFFANIADKGPMHLICKEILQISDN